MYKTYVLYRSYAGVTVMCKNTRHGNIVMNQPTLQITEGVMVSCSHLRRLYFGDASVGSTCVNFYFYFVYIYFFFQNWGLRRGMDLCTDQIW
ncbi:hypothetical protein I7I53_12193 [Histoplasma capsulatum var. duboisii H88]|uniref:Uncharacterized protein n=1 Tax=Ajellomyces capsulatus (strain H88) TaxID=544711 RepID=A0A8A1M112_AJEC8|nr:hypothetical protein I7I53_12193 [Histoplasma capsulatum var. duboisii H88]